MWDEWCEMSGVRDDLCEMSGVRQAAAGQHQQRAPQLLQKALCTAPATQQAAAGQGRQCAR